MRPRSKSCYVERVNSNFNKSSDENTQQNEEMEGWNAGNDMRLIRQIWEQLPQNDNLPYDERLQKIKWNKVFVFGRKKAELKDRFENILSKIRKYRLLGEILKEIEKETMNLINLPVKPVNAFTLFMEENKDKLKEKTKNDKTSGIFSKLAAKLYNELPENEKEMYKKKADDRKLKYNDALSQYKLKDEKKGKNGPLTFYWEHRKAQDANIKYNEARTEFSSMSKEQRLKWLLKWLQVEPNKKLNLDQYLLAKEVLGKSDMKLIDMYEGRPARMNGYAFFLKEFISSFKPENKIPLPQMFKEATKQWGSMSLDEKSQYTLLSKKIKEEYTKFIVSLPEERQKYEVRRMAKKKPQRKSSDSDDTSDNAATITSKTTMKNTKSKNDKNVDQINSNIQTKNDSDNDNNQKKKKKKKLKKNKDEIKIENTETTLQSPPPISLTLQQHSTPMTEISDINVLSYKVERKSPEKEKSSNTRKRKKKDIKNVELSPIIVTKQSSPDVINDVNIATDEIKPLSNVEKRLNKNQKKQKIQKNDSILTSSLASSSAELKITPSTSLLSLKRKRKNSENQKDDSIKLTRIDNLDELEKSKNNSMLTSSLVSSSAELTITPSTSLSPKRKRKNSENQKDDDTKLKSNKQKKNNKFPEKPPSSAYKYFVLNIYKGPMNKAKASYKSLSAAKKNAIERKYIKIKENFLKDVKTYVGKLTVKERKEFTKFYSNSMDDEISDLTESDSTDSE